MKFEILKFKSVTSTNDIAVNLIKEKKKLSGCIYADLQTKGRGSKGREWISELGNLFGTIFFQLRTKYPPFNEFSMVNPVIISEVIKKNCNKEISFKYPNDIFMNKKKICGILQEVISHDSNKFLIIGIGVNIISNPKVNNFYKTTSILHETDKKLEVKELISQLVNAYENFFNNLETYNFKSYKNKIELMSIK